MAHPTNQLDSLQFNAQHVAHRLLRATTSPGAPQTFRGYASPNRDGARAALAAEAQALGMALGDRRVAMVGQWIGINSGVAVEACAGGVSP